jgi:metal-responsive CopG/Arc/MetJ family transcriptional regulator
MAKEVVKVVAVRLPVGLWREVQHRAVDEDRSAQELVADALRDYLKRRKGATEKRGKRKERGTE